jgi:acetyl esterase/lipase
MSITSPEVRAAIDAAHGQFFPTDRTDPASAPLMLILPGGGYHAHAPHETEPVAKWLNEAGLNAYVYWYPLAPARYPSQIVATRQLLAELRQGRHGSFDPDRIGVIAFSAGGHLAAMLCNAPTPTERAAHEASSADPQTATLGASQAAIDPDDLALRPDLAILAYAVTSMIMLPSPSSPKSLFGPDAPLSLRTETSAEFLVDADTPPTFLWHTAEDATVPLTHALRYAEALMLHGRQVDLHVYNEGAHGAGLGEGLGPLEGWTDLAVDWLRHHGW